MKTNIYDKITKQIVEQLEAGIVPWHKPWMGVTGTGCISHVSGKPYSLLNQWLLGHRAGEWLTYNQIQAEGGHVKKGEKASMVVFWTTISKVVDTKVINETDDKGEVVGTETRETLKYYPVLKEFQVFHIDQTEGIKPRFNNEPVQYEHNELEEAEAIVAGYLSRDGMTNEREGLCLEIVESDRAYYSPRQDLVRVPELRQYKVAEEYYSTLFHELTHSTGHQSRLNRDEVTSLHFFGDTGYSKEELVAEIGAAYLCQHAGFDCEKAFNNSVAYIAGWLKALKDDKRMIVSAAAKAEAAAKYILNGKQQ